MRLNGYDDYDGNGDDRCGSTAGRPAGPYQDGQRAHTRAAGHGGHGDDCGGHGGDGGCLDGVQDGPPDNFFFNRRALILLTSFKH